MRARGKRLVETSFIPFSELGRSGGGSTKGLSKSLSFTWDVLTRGNMIQELSLSIRVRVLKWDPGAG